MSSHESIHTRTGPRAHVAAAPALVAGRLSWRPPARDAPLFSALDLDLREGERLGVVGANGTGKTTLLRLIAGQLTPDEGRIVRAGPARLLPQEPPTIAEGDAVRDSLLGLDPELGPLRRRLREHELGGVPDGSAYARDLARYGDLGGWEVERLAEAEAERLGLGAAALDRPAAGLSGGERRMLQLASLLARRPTLLLLDEPSEALDEPASRRLSERLAAFPGALVVASHDRALLEEVTTLTLAFERGGPRLARMPYGRYRAAREAERVDRERRAARARREIAHLEEVARGYATWGGRKEKEKSGAFDKGFVGARAARLQKRAVQARERRQDEIGALREAVPWVEPEYRLPMPTPQGLRGGIVSLHACTALAGGREPFAPLDLRIEAGERVAVTGPNGAGKSTLLALLTGVLAPERGRAWRQRRAGWGYLPQHAGPAWFAEGTPADHFAAAEAAEARRRLGALGMSEAGWRTPLAHLSGGQRQKVRLVRLLAEAPDVLVLDEPTVHLDLPALERLEAALAAWPGTVVLASHDRAFRSAVATRTVRLEAPAPAGDLA